MRYTLRLHRITKVRLCFSFVIGLLILNSWAKAQTIELRKESNPNPFEAYYQLQSNKELYLQVKAEGGHLKLVQQWDYKEVQLNQTSELTYASEKPGLNLVFSKDPNGSIATVLVNGRDLWVKDHTYKPEPIAELSPAQVTALKNTLNKAANEVVRAINSNSAAATQQFMETHVSQAFMKSGAVDLLTLLPRIYRQTGGVQMAENVSLNTKATMADFKARGKYLENIFEFNIRVDKEGKIRLFNGRIMPDPTLANIRKGDQEFIQSLRTTMTALAEKDLFSGTILLAKGDKVLFTFASGEANKETHQTNNADTRFSLGSMNKMFTSLSIMQLGEKGKLNLTDPVSKFIDTTWLPTGIADKITIHHLLSHTSGMGDLFTPEYEKANLPQLIKVDAFKPYIKTDKLLFEPGKSWDYSNAGMVLLGAVIEKVSGIDYYYYIRQNIYKPAGMTHSDVYDIDTHPHNLAIGYIPQPDGRFESNRNSMWNRGNPSGGGYSNLSDLHKFALALTSGKLVSAASQQKMYTDYMHREYGYGFQVFSYKNYKIVGHSGGAPGVNAVTLMEPQSGYTMVVLSNYDGAIHLLQNFMLNRIKANLD